VSESNMAPSYLVIAIGYLALNARA
jgi:hypothetical protein